MKLESDPTLFEAHCQTFYFSSALSRKLGLIINEAFGDTATARFDLATNFYNILLADLGCPKYIANRQVKVSPNPQSR